MKFPTISIVTLTYNANPNIWEKVLLSIKNQDYPENLTEHLVMDGGSTNNTIQLANKYGCKVHVMSELRYESESRKGRGIKLAKHDLVAFIEADNILPNKNWFREMVQPLMDKQDVVGAFSMYNSFETQMPILTRYCALFGINDPVVYYLGKSEKLTRFQEKYDKGKIISVSRKYTIVKFNTGNLPTLGDNGHLVRRELIMKVNQNPDKFLHTDAFANLLNIGYNTYAAVNNSIIHFTGASMNQFLTRRSVYKKIMFDQKRRERKYLVFNPDSLQDQMHLILYILFSITFIEPLIESCYGYLKLKDKAWFLHPFICTITLFTYAQSEILYRYNKIILNLHAKSK